MHYVNIEKKLYNANVDIINQNSLKLYREIGQGARSEFATTMPELSTTGCYPYMKLYSYKSTNAIGKQRARRARANRCVRLKTASLCSTCVALHAKIKLSKKAEYKRVIGKLNKNNPCKRRGTNARRLRIYSAKLITCEITCNTLSFVLSSCQQQENFKLNYLFQTNNALIRKICKINSATIVK